MIHYLGFAKLGGYAVRERGINNSESSLNHQRQVIGRGASNKLSPSLLLCETHSGFLLALRPAERPLALEALRAGSAGSLPPRRPQQGRGCGASAPREDAGGMELCAVDAPKLSP